MISDATDCDSTDSSGGPGAGRPPAAGPHWPRFPEPESQSSSVNVPVLGPTADRHGRVTETASESEQGCRCRGP
jgi:hypothetical protein